MADDALNLESLRLIEPWLRQAQRNGRLDAAAAIEIMAELYALQLRRVKSLSKDDAAAAGAASPSPVDFTSALQQFAAQINLSQSAAEQLSLLIADEVSPASPADLPQGQGSGLADDAANASLQNVPRGVAAPTEALASPGVHPGAVGQPAADQRTTPADDTPAAHYNASPHPPHPANPADPPAPASLRDFLTQRNVSVALAASVLVAAVVAGLLIKMWNDAEARVILLAVPAVLVLAWGSTLRRWREPAGVAALALVLVAVPLHVIAVGAWQVRPSVVAVELLMALVMAMLASRELRLPGAASGVLLVLMAATSFLMRPEILNWLPQSPLVEFFLLALYAAGAWSIIGGLYRRRLELDSTMRVATIAAMGAMLLSYALVSFNLLSDHAGLIGVNWIGPWAVAGAAPLVGAAVVLLLVPPEGGAAPAMRVAAIICFIIAGLALIAGLVLSSHSRQSMLVSLCLAFFLTALAGAYLEGRRARPFQAMASLLLPAWAACWAGRWAGGDVGWTNSPDAALGFGVGVSLIYLFGLWLNRPGQAWSRNIPLVSSISLAIPAVFWLALVRGGSALVVPGVHQFSWATLLMAAMALGGLATAWRVRWEPMVYLSSLALLSSIAVRAVRISGASMGEIFLRHLTVNVTLLAVVLVLAGGLLACFRRRDARAAFYCEGMLVMGLAATTLMSLLAGLTAWETGLHPHHVAQLGVLALSLLVVAIVFRQEDLFGFFGLALQLAALAAFGVWGESVGRTYLARYTAVALMVSLLLAAVSALLSRRAGDDPLKHRFAWGLYVSSLAGPAVALGLMWMTENPLWRGIDMIIVAAIVALMRTHTARPITNYAVIAAITAGAFYIVAHYFSSRMLFLHNAAMVAAAALALIWLLAAIILRRILLAMKIACDRDARRHGRPFTVVGMATIAAVSSYLALLTILGYRAAIVENASPLRPAGLPPFSAEAMMIAWGFVLAGMLASIWIFRHSLRTYAFYALGSMATVSLGLMLTADGELLLDYLIIALGAYGAAHLLVYLAEGQFMRLLSGTCALYREERHASTAIFSAGCLSCFAAATLSAFFLYRPAAMVMLGILTLVFFIWSLLYRRAEMLYPAVIISIEFLLSIWHVIHGPGPWTPERLAVNSLVFASGAVLWMTIGWQLNRLRGPWSLLNTPARHMSVIVGLISLGFFIALALSAAWHDANWHAWGHWTDLTLGLIIGATLTVYFGWVGRDFRRGLFIYLACLSLTALAAFMAIRLGRPWPHLAEWWPVLVVAALPALLAVTRPLERKSLVFFGRPLFYCVTLFLPLVPLAGAIMAAYDDRFDLATPTFLMLGVLYLAAARIRERALLTRFAVVALVAAIFCLWRWAGIDFEHHPQFFLVPAGIALIMLARSGRTRLRPETVEGIALLGLVVAFGGSVFEVVLKMDDASGFPYAYLFSISTGMIGVAAGVKRSLPMVRNVGLALLAVDLALGLAALTWWEGRAWLVLLCTGLVGGSLGAIGLLARGHSSGSALPTDVGEMRIRPPGDEAAIAADAGAGDNPAEERARQDF